MGRLALTQKKPWGCVYNDGLNYRAYATEDMWQILSIYIPGLWVIPHKMLLTVIPKSRDPLSNAEQTIDTTSRGDTLPFSIAYSGLSAVFSRRWGQYLVSTYLMLCLEQSSQNS